MKHLLAAVLIFSGCAALTPAKPMDSAQIGENLASFKSAASPYAHHQFCKTVVFELLQSQRYQELDHLLERIGKADPVEILSTPCSLTLEMLEIQKEVGEYPWLQYFADGWEKSTHSPWSRVARAQGMLGYGSALMEFAGSQSSPLGQEGVWFYKEGLKIAEQAAPNDPARPYFEVNLNLVRGDRNKAMLDAIHKYPTEIGLYLYLGEEFSVMSRADKARILKGLIDDSPANYALFFTLQLPIVHARKIQADGWEWDPLKQGFQALLKDHPKALGVRNAFAAAASIFEDQSTLANQASELGCLVDLHYWDSLDAYKKALGKVPDAHLNASKCTLPPLDEFLAKSYFTGLAAWQARDLLQKEQWAALDAYLAGLSNPDRIYEAEQYLQTPREETEASYRAREALLKSWRESRPDSKAATAILGGFYISYAWLARGEGTADTVKPEGWKLFRERMKTAQDLLYDAYGSGYQSEDTMANLMTVYNAGTSNLESARKLALQAAAKGRTGNAALAAYANLLLPRWQGQPGDMEAAANELRQKTGNDMAYHVLLSVVIEQEGRDCLKPGHPVAMNWERAIRSYLEAGKAGRLSFRTAQRYLKYCSELNKQKDAARILPFVPPSGQEEWPILLLAQRKWAGGYIPWVGDKPTYKFTSFGPQVQKAGPGAKVGFSALLSHPFPTGHHYVIEVETFGRPSYQLVDNLDPMVGKRLNCYAGSGRAGLPPGRYTVRLLDGELDKKEQKKVLHSETFELVP